MSTSRQRSVSAERSRIGVPQRLEHDAMSQQRELDVTKRDRFELLSAYLDGEVSPEERRLVMTWLADDPNIQSLYSRLLQLRQGFQGICQTGWESDASERTATAVIHELNHRFRLTCMAGLTAAAVAFISVFSGALNQPMGRFSIVQTSAPASPRDSLEIALDQPPILIPKSAVSADSTSMEAVLQSQPGLHDAIESEL
ncbi:MAG: zf-HC2 domain-containing protein [Leptolyngbya sp. SIO1D8]|nr:zf-HC2 domain-containing protein [Leptolyngbya sp. SIO1D8]